jgi:hypothetical protein
MERPPLEWWDVVWAVMFGNAFWYIGLAVAEAAERHFF